MEGDVVEYFLFEYVRFSGFYGVRSYGFGVVSEIVVDDFLFVILCYIELLVMVFFYCFIFKVNIIV